MNLLLDTHILIWALNEDSRLSAKAKELILDPDHMIYYSTVSIWEVAIKHALHPDNMEFTGMELAGFSEEAGFMNLPVKNRHVFALETLKREEGAPVHKDPFDRMLVAQAGAENMLFLTHDTLIPYYEGNYIVSV